MKSLVKVLLLTALFAQSTLVLALTVGVTGGPHAVIMEEVKKAFEKKGYTLKVVEFNDFILPNAALDQKEIDVNSYQHQPFLDDQIKSRGYKLVAVGKTLTLPLGIYSAQHTSLENIPEGAKVAIPNDPTNSGRALLLLQKAGLIELKTLENPTILDIAKNSKKLKFIELEAPQQPRTLKDVDLSVIITDWVLVAGLDAKKALLTEGKDSPYANIIVVRQGDENRADTKALVSVYQSPLIKSFIEKHYRGAILPAW